MLPEPTFPYLDHLSPEDNAFLQSLRKPQHDGRFAPKLSEAERCQVLAASLYGIPRPVVAAAFGIDRRTVTHIVSEHSPHYKATRNVRKQIGNEEFMKKYLDPDTIAKVNKAFNDPDTKKNSTQMRADAAARLSAQKQAEGPNPKANKHEGVQSVPCEQHDNELVRVNIFWYDGEYGKGWCFASPNDEKDLRRNESFFHTSTDALRDAKLNFYDSTL